MRYRTFPGSLRPTSFHSGYCGILPWGDDHPLGVHDEIGWRLIRDAWGHGYATEAANRCAGTVLAYTAAENVRSQQVMERLGLRRDPSLDFSQHYDGFGMWSGLVRVASAVQHNGDAGVKHSREYGSQRRGSGGVVMKALLFDCFGTLVEFQPDRSLLGSP